MTELVDWFSLGHFPPGHLPLGHITPGHFPARVILSPPMTPPAVKAKISKKKLALTQTPDHNRSTAIDFER